jgi:hypothetical protein
VILFLFYAGFDSQNRAVTSVNNDNRSHRPINKDMREEKCVPVLDWLGSKVKVQDWLEDKANNLVPDEGPLNCEIEH